MARINAHALPAAGGAGGGPPAAFISLGLTAGERERMLQNRHEDAKLKSPRRRCSRKPEGGNGGARATVPSVPIRPGQVGLERNAIGAHAIGGECWCNGKATNRWRFISSDGVSSCSSYRRSSFSAFLVSSSGGTPGLRYR